MHLFADGCNRKERSFFADESLNEVADTRGRVAHSTEAVFEA